MKSQMDYYKEKGLTRYTMVLPQAHKDKVERLAKTFRVTQGEVIEVLLDQVDEAALGPHFEARRAVKTDGRKGSKRSIISNMKDLTPEQLLQIEEQIAKLKAGK